MIVKKVNPKMELQVRIYSSTCIYIPALPSPPPPLLSLSFSSIKRGLILIPSFFFFFLPSSLNLVTPYTRYTHTHTRTHYTLCCSCFVVKRVTSSRILAPSSSLLFLGQPFQRSLLEEDCFLCPRLAWLPTITIATHVIILYIRQS